MPVQSKPGGSAPHRVPAENWGYGPVRTAVNIQYVRGILAETAAKPWLSPIATRIDMAARGGYTQYGDVPVYVHSSSQCLEGQRLTSAPATADRRGPGPASQGRRSRAVTSRVRQGGKYNLMTENERRAQDVLTREDLILRGFAVTGLISMFLLMLLVVNP